MRIKQKLKKHFLVISDSKAIYNIPWEAIIRIEALGSYSLTYTTMGKKYTSCKNLSAIHRELAAANDFCRIHNSHIVNLNKVKGMYKKEKSGILVMTDDSEVPVSRRKKPELLKNIKGS